MARRTSRIGLLFAAALAMLPAAGCSPDLHETFGPRVPVPPEPNVRGSVLRDGAPLADRKVKLEDAATDSTIAEDRTDAGGRYAFAEVGAGSWVLKVSSSTPGEFATVTYEFAFASSDTMIDAPPLDVAQGDLEADSPEDGAEMPPPSPFQPLTFAWQRPQDPTCTVQVRVYDPEGRSFWYSEKSDGESARWNGIGNQGESAGAAADTGSYIWRLRLEWDEEPIEGTTSARDLVFRGD